MLSVLRIGGGETEVDFLHNALLSYFDSSSSSSPTSNKTSINITISPDDDGILTVTNKYFTARIAIETTTTTAKNNNNDDDDDETNDRKEDGIILVFNSQLTSFESLSFVHTTAESQNRCGDLLRLCVGIISPSSSSSSSNTTSEKEYSRRVLWCLDRGYEYVEADLSEEGRREGHDRREKEGFARIVEAVGGTVWSSAVMHPKNRSADETTDGGLAAAEGETTEDGNEGGDAIDDGNGYEPPGDWGAMTMTDDATGMMPPIALPQDVPNASSSSCHDKNGSTNKTNEVIFDDLDRFMKEAKQIRDDAKGGMMTDEERRQRAGDTAIKLMGILDSLGFDEDEDDDVVDSSDEE